jgi:hypothetical protein
MRTKQFLFSFQEVDPAFLAAGLGGRNDKELLTLSNGEEGTRYNSASAQKKRKNR